MDIIKEEIDNNYENINFILEKYEVKIVKHFYATYNSNTCELFRKYYKEIYLNSRIMNYFRRDNDHFYINYCTLEEFKLFFQDMINYGDTNKVQDIFDILIKSKQFEKYVYVITIIKNYNVATTANNIRYNYHKLILHKLRFILSNNVLENISIINWFYNISNPNLNPYFITVIEYFDEDKMDYIQFSSDEIIYFDYIFNAKNLYNVIKILSLLDPKHFIFSKYMLRKKIYKIMDKDIAIRLARNTQFYNKYSLVHLGIPRHLFQNYTKCKYFRKLDQKNIEIRKVLDLLFIPEISQMIQSFIIV